jgi:glycerophosphoryl diester phosphodiesterase
MRIISHRGYWKDKNEKNTEIAFERSFSLGYGTETDFRDYNGELVISHDIPSDESKLSLETFVEIFKKFDPSLPLAINIKSDGLQNLIKELIQSLQVEEYFVFDMSIPDTIGYLNSNIDFYIRQSEYEKDLPFYKNAKGIWLDAFEGIWYNESHIKTHLENGKKVAIVSAELHKRDYKTHWAILKKWSLLKNDNIILCTDIPEVASIYFNS